MTTGKPEGCNGCAECCYYLEIETLDKPVCQTCRHVTPHGYGNGCGVYPMRPGSCRTFECLWLQAEQAGSSWASPGLRPDACGVMFVSTTNDDTVAAHTRDMDQLDKNPKVAKLIGKWLSNGIRVIAVQGTRRRFIAHVSQPTKSRT